jgi:hypothetical protein
MPKCIYDNSREDFMLCLNERATITSFNYNFPAILLAMTAIVCE